MSKWARGADMVDGIRAAGVGDQIAPVTRTATTAAPVPVATPRRDTAPQLAALAKSVAAAAPVDGGRVARIKAALANGTFPILPATIADRLMAFRYDWMSDDQA